MIPHLIVNYVKQKILNEVLKLKILKMTLNHKWNNHILVQLEKKKQKVLNIYHVILKIIKENY